MTMEASLDIQFSLNGKNGRLLPTIRSSRRADICQIFVGKQRSALQDVLPRLYSICGMAHRHASAVACGLYEGEPHRKLWGDVLVLAEAAREHGLHILSHWQGEAQHGFHLSMRSLLVENRNLESLSDVTEARFDHALAFVDTLRKLIERDILGGPIDGFLQLSSQTDFISWSQEADSVAGRYLLSQSAPSQRGLGEIKPHFLPTMGTVELRDILLSSNGTDFAANPTWGNAYCETGPLSRQFRHPLLAAVCEDGKSGLLSRNLARLIDLALMPDRLENLIEMRHSVASEPFENEGLGLVETARGLLVHAVERDGDLIKAYRILAPTEWNFHPHGAAACSLKTLSASDDLLDQANSIIQAIDPCVAFNVLIDKTISLQEATHA